MTCLIYFRSAKYRIQLRMHTHARSVRDITHTVHVGAFVRACARLCVRACARACVRAFAYLRVCGHMHRHAILNVMNHKYANARAHVRTCTHPYMHTQTRTVREQNNTSCYYVLGYAIMPATRVSQPLSCYK